MLNAPVLAALLFVQVQMLCNIVINCNGLIYKCTFKKREICAAFGLWLILDSGTTNESSYIIQSDMTATCPVK